MDRKELVEALIALLGTNGVVHAPDDVMTYECDGQTLDKETPLAVVFPESAEDVSAIVRLCNQASIPFLPRGAGTGLSGGALAIGGGVIIEMARMKAIREVDYDNQQAVIEPGLVNARLTRATQEKGFYYAPDPSSQPACTIGGNVAENAGGPHTLKYGVTTNHTLGLEIVLPDGEIVQTGGAVLDAPGYDLTGLFTGSEGTFGIATKIISRILPTPETCKTLLGIYSSVDDASASVSGIIGAGIVPAALEMMDYLFIQAVENWIHAGFPLDAEAVLIIELDGIREGMDELAEKVMDICRKNNAVEVRAARSEEERAKIWKGRKSAFGAVGRICPTYYTHDGVIPRTKLPEVLRRIRQIGEEYGLRIANVFHAGDGNLHPVILFDARKPEETRNALAAGDKVLRACVEAGGTLTGEHGIGCEKRDLMPLIFSPDDLETFSRIRKVWNPEGLCNPGKVIPTPSHCFDKTARLETAHQAAV